MKTAASPQKTPWQKCPNEHRTPHRTPHSHPGDHRLRAQEKDRGDISPIAGGGLSHGEGRGIPPPLFCCPGSPFFYHRRDVLRGRIAATIGSPAGRLLRLRLHRRCARRQFARSYGEPPLETGTISSTSGEPGKPWGSVVSTALPHSQQFCSSRRTRLRSLLRADPLVRRGFGLFVMAHLHEVVSAVRLVHRRTAGVATVLPSRSAGVFGWGAGAVVKNSKATPWSGLRIFLTEA